MDSNVSKNTNSHNFFKIEVKRKKLGIAAKNLLKQELLLILNLYQQKFNVQIEQKLITSISENKISFSNHKNFLSQQKSSQINAVQNKFVPFVYSCPIGLLLKGKPPQTSQTKIQQIEQILGQLQNQTATEPSFFMSIETVDRGWINFYLDSKFMDIWLQQQFIWHQQEVVNDQPLIEQECGLRNSPTNLFPLQYTHARCYSLLQLGVRAGLISLSTSSANVQPIPRKTFPWLDEENTLCLTEPSERHLLHQLLIVADFWMEDASSLSWSQLALNLSEATAIFLADCRFLGGVKVQYPDLALARLGLIALVQLWLQKILVEKLNIAAPKSL